MAFDVGSRLGHYEVTALIGEGGMGQVYQATDTKLKRLVALKILPEAFSADPERLARFQREAEVLASLNHPNIAAIHGLEEADDTRALVLELVEGPTLADRIKRGPIPLDEALPIAKQIAEALEAAHEAGVIHRDLKPANIKVKDDGTVKVLDFGLAKALDPNPEGDSSQSPTLTAAATQMGVIMGTAAYMSPEQARGKPTDRRADIWAFGAVLFEMLTGKRAFEGEDVLVTLANVIKEEPEWQQLPAAISPSLRTYLLRCLDKDPTRRVQAIGDVRLAVDGAFESEAAQALSRDLRVWQRPLAAVSLAGLLMLVTGLTVWITVSRPGQTPGVLRAHISPGNSIELDLDVFLPSIAISPDGTTLVYRGSEGTGETSLYRRRLDGAVSEPIAGTQDGLSAFFSPDGGSVGFVTERRTQLHRVSLVGGVVTVVASFPSIVIGASWGTDDQIVTGQRFGGLFRVSAEGGEPEALTVPDEATGGEAHRWPFLVRGRRVVLFAIFGDAEDASSGELAALDLDTRNVVRLGLRGTVPRYTVTGHLVYATHSGVLQAVPFDLDTLAVLGDPVALGETVAFKSSSAGAEYGVSDAGRLVYVPTGSLDEGAALEWVNRSDGGVTRLAVDGLQVWHPRLSPDGGQVAYWDGSDIWAFDLTRQSGNRITSDERGMVPLWSRDGKTLIYAWTRVSTPDIYSKPTDSTADASLILENQKTLIPSSLSPDGRQLLYHVVEDEQGRDLWVKPIGEEPYPFLQTGFDERCPSFSPDGRWVAYLSDSSGETRVYLQPFPSSGQVIQISAGPGTEPVWSRDGKQLYYRNGPQVIGVTIEIGPDDSITVGRAEPILSGDYPMDPIGIGMPNYDVSKDGQKFLMSANRDSAGPPTITLVDNWFEELTRLVPTP